MSNRFNDDMSVAGVSYIGAPVSNTAMFVTNKVSRLLDKLSDAENCLVFAENRMDVSEILQKRHRFVFSDNPQMEYARFVSAYAQEKELAERRLAYRLTPEGYYCGENVTIGSDCYIEPLCVIGHGVVIGDRARILAGAVIKNAVIGDDFICNEGAVIGAKGFTMTEDENGNKFRIPTLGRVCIGNHVEVGARDNISCGSGGDTVMEDYVKLDALVHIGHDVHLHRNVEITAGAVIGGFDEIRENTFVGINATLRNRITVGSGARVSMGAVATQNVVDGQTVTGNFAVEHGRFISELKERNAKFENVPKSARGGYRRLTFLPRVRKEVA